MKTPRSHSSRQPACHHRHVEPHPAGFPLSHAADVVFEPSGKTLFSTRQRFQGSQAKRYQGGTAQKLWKYTSGQEAVPLTADFDGTSGAPMWWKDRVYFLSDSRRHQ